MQIDVEEFQSGLKQLETELLADLERSETDARDAASAEVEDAIDVANTDLSKDLILDEGHRDFDKLQMVREALQRIDSGTYGICVECGREIPEARLRAVPWTPYCVEDQAKREPQFTPATL